MLGAFQTTNFTCAESNAIDKNLLFSFLCIRFGSCKVRRLKRALLYYCDVFPSFHKYKNSVGLKSSFCLHILSFCLLLSPFSSNRLSSTYFLTLRPLDRRLNFKLQGCTTSNFEHFSSINLHAITLNSSCSSLTPRAVLLRNLLGSCSPRSTEQVTNSSTLKCISLAVAVQVASALNFITIICHLCTFPRFKHFPSFSLFHLDQNIGSIFYILPFV